MRPYQQCNRCILDTNDDPFIVFDDKGVCNHCLKYDKQAKEQVFTGEIAKQKFDAIIAKIKEEGKGKPYDTILGVSGGVDSTYLAYLSKQYGLRVLLFHFDNGWDSELSVKNIENMATKLGYDLSTYVVDWNEFKDIQLSYIKAGVVDIEAITDHAAKVATIRLAKQYKIHNVLIGTNIVTESVLPDYWIFPKRDWRNLKDIHRKFGAVKLKSLPVSSIWEDFYNDRVFKPQFHSLLDLVPYVKDDVKKLIIKELDWKDYGGKHYESIWTRFYQGYILPEKFHIDKRKAHLSNLICSGQITKEQAFEEMKLPIYDPEQLKVDKDFVLKKLNFTEAEFDEYIKKPRREHTEFDHVMHIDKRYPVLAPVKKLYRMLFPVG
jgi:hypothetical protein